MPSLVDRALRPFQEFAATESAGGIVLLACAIAALGWANSAWSDSYFRLWEQRATIGIGAWSLSWPLHRWINDGAMVLFFFLVGLEIKRELLVGELASLRRATLPISAAIGGMVLPALVYTAVLAGRPGAHGWAIPMATDIAFSLGALSLLGSRVPPALKVFLTAFAIVDDIGAIVVIAIFYHGGFSGAGLTAVFVVLGLLTVCNRIRIQALSVYVVLGITLWLAVLASGIHATVAGVLLAMMIPSQSRTSDDEAAPPAEPALLLRMERALHHVVAFGIMPLFALANAGVRLRDGVLTALDWRIVAGVVLGLIIGKSCGILSAAWGATKLRIAVPLTGVRWSQVYGVSWLGGIGFTMSLFIASLAFGESTLLDSAKVGIFCGSVVAGTVGVWLLGAMASNQSGSRPRTSPRTTSGTVRQH